MEIFVARQFNFETGLVNLKRFNFILPLNISLDLKLSKAVFSLDPDNLQLHCLFFF